MFVNRLPFYSPKALRTLMVVTAVLCGLAAIGLRVGIARSGSAGIKAVPNVQTTTKSGRKSVISSSRAEESVLSCRNTCERVVLPMRQSAVPRRTTPPCCCSQKFFRGETNDLS